MKENDVKVKEIRFRPLGRMPKKGEWYRWGARGPIYDNCGLFPEIDYSAAVAQEGVEVDVDVPDPVPEWIKRVQLTMAGEEEVAAAFRAHVEERAKAAVVRWLGPVPGSTMFEDLKRGEAPQDGLARMIREEFLR